VVVVVIVDGVLLLLLFDPADAGRPVVLVNFCILFFLLKVFFRSEFFLLPRAPIADDGLFFFTL